MEAVATQPPLSLQGSTAKQLKAFGEFRQRAIDHCTKSGYTEGENACYLNEENLARMCIARSFKEKNAFSMWLKWVHFRRDFEVDSITEESVRKELDKKQAFIHRHDKEMRPCTVHLPRRHNPKERDVEEMVRCFVLLMEKAAREADALGSGQCCCLLDMEGVTKSNVDKQAIMAMKRLVGISQDFYPERLAVLYVLNANAVFKFAYALVRPFLSKRTKEKIVVLDTQDDLLKYFHPENLLEAHGGSSAYDFAPVTADGKRIEEGKITESPVDVEGEDFEWLQLKMTEEELKLIAERDEEEIGEEEVNSQSAK